MAASAEDSAERYLPSKLSLRALEEASARCKGCELWRSGTQTVFGEGPRSARMVLVGEQPGDQEDLQGRPFVGPAGRLLDELLVAAGIDRRAVYLTNAVKHFKWVARGKRRLHEKPSAREVAACRPWALAELELLAPRVLVCLGATATQSLLGPKVKVMRDRGKPLPSELAAHVIVTVHPSSLLRLPDPAARQEGRARFVDDLRLAASFL